ncbi:MAG TPA: hypothetical protein PLR26_00980 [Bacilli bacterium]|nr:hypothetical protein [Bacilli bacterium]
MIVVSAINDFFYNFFSSFNFQSFLTLLFGIMIGFFIFGAVYVVTIVISVKNDEKFKIKLKSEVDIDDEEIVKIVESIKKTFQADSVGLKTGDKIKLIGDMSWEIIYQIAEKYYPTSDHPVYELTLDEFLALNHYITNRIDSILGKKMLKVFRNMRVSKMIRFFETKRKVEEAKIVKAANKMQLPKVWKATMGVLNAVNPIYWFRKIVLETTYNSTVNKISLLILDIVAEETHKVYSKSIFNVEPEITSSVDSFISENEELIEDEE